MLDLNKHYMLPMSPTWLPESEEDYIECVLKRNGNHIVVDAVKDGYRTKRFYLEYLEFLYRTGYVRDVEQFHN